MRNHRKWTAVIEYFSEIPIDNDLIDNIQILLDRGENILIMIKKENHEENPEFTPEEKFKALCEIFPTETKTGEIIISIVPDINKVIEL